MLNRIVLLCVFTVVKKRPQQCQYINDFMYQTVEVSGNMFNESFNFMAQQQRRNGVICTPILLAQTQVQPHV